MPGLNDAMGCQNNWIRLVDIDGGLELLVQVSLTGMSPFMSCDQCESWTFARSKTEGSRSQLAILSTCFQARSWRTAGGVRCGGSCKARWRLNVGRHLRAG